MQERRCHCSPLMYSIVFPKYSAVAIRIHTRTHLHVVIQYILLFSLKWCVYWRFPRICCSMKGSAKKNERFIRNQSNNVDRPMPLIVYVIWNDVGFPQSWHTHAFCVRYVAKAVSFGKGKMKRKKNGKRQRPLWETERKKIVQTEVNLCSRSRTINRYCVEQFYVTIMVNAITSLWFQWMGPSMGDGTTVTCIVRTARHTSFTFRSYTHTHAIWTSVNRLKL